MWYILGALALVASASCSQADVQAGASESSNAVVDTSSRISNDTQNDNTRDDESNIDNVTDNAIDFAPSSYADAVGFWAPLAHVSVLEPEYFNSLEQMSTSATVVIVGKIESGGVTRTVGDPTGQEGPVMDFWGLNIRVLQVLAGELEPNSGQETIVVETHFRTNDRVPKGAGIFFLRHKLDVPPEADLGPLPEGEEDKYRLVSSQGVFVESPRGMINPIVEAARESAEGDDDVPTDEIAEQVRGMTVGQLIAAIRSSR